MVFNHSLVSFYAGRSCAADGEAGLRKALTGDYQLVILDLMLPGMDGMRHTPGGGRVSINVDLDSTNVTVRVADTGCGISSEEVPRIFERFYQRDKNTSDNHSAGLGLAIVKRILELHGSVIKVQSKINHGTTFTFELGARAAV